MEILRRTKSGLPVVGVNEKGRNLYMISCSMCSTQFISLGSNAKCCDKCKDNKSVDVNICLLCGKQFLGKDGYQKYCAECEKTTLSDVKHVNTKMNSDKAYDITPIIEAKVKEIINKSKEKGNTYNDVLLNYWGIGCFNDSIKNEVRKRDNHTCQVCGKTTNLHVHHIIPRRNGGNHELDNLILLCSSCHMAIETGDIHHATKKCTKNALKHGGVLSNTVYKVTDSYKVTILQSCLENMFEKLSTGDFGEDVLKDMLMNISSTLDKIEN